MAVLADRAVLLKVGQGPTATTSYDGYSYYIYIAPYLVDSFLL